MRFSSAISLVLWCWVSGGAACTRDLDHDLADDVSILQTREGRLAQEAIARVAARGTRAIPWLETALHTANVAGRLNCVLALRRIGDAEAIPLLRHVAVYDAEEPVRKEAEFTLRDWAKDDAKKTAPRAAAARQAVRAIEQERGDSHTG